MGPWAILCMLLCLQPALAEVVNNFTGNCAGFFYKSAEPSFFQSTSHVRLCQEWHADDNYKRVARFPTLYDKSNRIPIWSAYLLATNSKGQHANPPSSWYVEAQLAGNNLGTAMLKEQAIDDKDALKTSQAINADYEGSDFDRGHLFPNSLQDTNHRLSTFTLTNAVPMDPCFNRLTWAKLEQSLKGQLLANCVNVGGTPYLVTGSVPDANRKIPIRDPDVNPPLPIRDTERVSVPSHMWTTVCCDHPEAQRKFTLAFLGENEAEGTLESITVEDLQNRLKTLYGSTQNLKIFEDACGSSDKNKEPLKAIVAAIEKATVGGNVKLDTALALKRKRAADLIAQQLGSPQKVLKVSDTSFALQFSNAAEWQKSYNRVPDFSCMLLSPGKIAHHFSRHDELRKRDVGSQSKGPLCLIQEATLPAPALGAKCVNDVCSQKGYKYSWCKTDYDRDYCCTEKCAYSVSSKRFECQSAGHGKVPCSPPYYSSVTITGGTCRGDHPCARYNKDYYWCYVNYDNGWEYCCAPTDPCGSKKEKVCRVSDNSPLTKHCYM